jgi:hypothetical protein
VRSLREQGRFPRLSQIFDENVMNTNIATLTAVQSGHEPAKPDRSSPSPPRSGGEGRGEVVPRAHGGNSLSSPLDNARSSKRLACEWRTIETMVRIYCRDHHEGGLCPECKGLLDYASVRLDRCRFGAEKPTCAKCPVHCYQRNRREQVRVVMRYAGPRMLWEHPILSLYHWLDGRRKPPGAPTS